MQQSTAPPDAPRNRLPVIAFLVPGLVLALGAIGFGAWLLNDPVQDLAVRLPDPDNASNQLGDLAPPIGQLTAGPGKPSDLPGSWPQFRGPDRDGVYSNPDVQLATSFPESGPTRLWSVPLGEGYAGPVVHKGRVYLLDYDSGDEDTLEDDGDVIRCLSLDDGREIWRVFYPVLVKRNHGMSRTVPAVNDEVLVTLGPKCHVMCLDPITGAQRWSLNLVGQFDTVVPEWYAGQSPLIDGDRVIIAPGGPQALMMALDAKTGSVIWKTPNPHGWKMSHASIMPIQYDGTRMYIYPTHEGGLVGVDAATGELLWETDQWQVKTATVCSATYVGEGKIFMADGYGSGCAMFQLGRDAQGRFTVSKLFEHTERHYGVTQQTTIFYKGHLYGINRSNGQLTCLDLQGNILWSSGQDQRFGDAPIVILNDTIYALREAKQRRVAHKDGELVIARATPDGFHLLGEYKVLHEGQPWGFPALAGTRLLVRDYKTLVCLDIGK